MYATINDDIVYIIKEWKNKHGDQAELLQTLVEAQTQHERQIGVVEKEREEFHSNWIEATNCLAQKETELSKCREEFLEKGRLLMDRTIEADYKSQQIKELKESLESMELDFSMKEKREKSYERIPEQVEDI